MSPYEAAIEPSLSGAVGWTPFMLLVGFVVFGGLTLLVGYPIWQALKRLGRASSVASGAVGAII